MPQIVLDVPPEHAGPLLAILQSAVAQLGGGSDRRRRLSDEEILEEMHLPAFELTAVGVDAALPNLFAEVMHPEVHWSKECDNGA